jgi:hypothetical protein
MNLYLEVHHPPDDDRAYDHSGYAKDYHQFSDRLRQQWVQKFWVSNEEENTEQYGQNDQHHC